MFEAERQRLNLEKSVTLSVRIRPNAPKTRVTDKMADGTLKIAVAAVPEDGKANRELVRFLAKEFGVPTGSVVFNSGRTSRLKKIRIALSG